MRPYHGSSRNRDRRSPACEPDPFLYLKPGRLEIPRVTILNTFLFHR